MRYLITSLILCTCTIVFAQKTVADSLAVLIIKETSDTSRVLLLTKKAGALQNTQADQALIIARQAYDLAVANRFVTGEAKSLGMMANILIKLGNYQQALSYHLQRLKIEETRNVPNDLATALLNIGVVYSFQQQYATAIEYYSKADSIINIYNNQKLSHSIKLNIGDAYDHQNKLDSSFKYFNESLTIAKSLKDDFRTGASLVGLGHTYRKEKDFRLGETYYSMGITDLKKSDAQDLLCEAYLGMAKLLQENQLVETSIKYADSSFFVANHAGFAPRQLDAANFLASIYKNQNNIDSAFIYLNKTIALNNEINSNEKIRQLQILSSDETIRQIEISQTKLKKEKQRKTQLRLLFIGIFIPAFFVFTLLLSRAKLNLKVLKFLGILSLLFLFEYLTLLFHPFVANITNHNPFLEIVIFVVAAMFLIPAHHRLEKWLVAWLLRNKEKKDQLKLQIKKIQMPTR